MTATSTATTIAWIKPILSKQTTQKPQMKPVCPTNCTKNSELFYSNGILKEKHGFWESACGGIQYLFGKKLVNWEQNAAICCSLGMTPIMFKDGPSCFNNIINGFKWKYSSRFWTSGRRVENLTFEWCFLNVSNSSSNILDGQWRPNQPDHNTSKSDNCIQLYILKEQSSALLDDRSCNETYFLACQVTRKSACLKPLCPSSGNCTKDRRLFSPYPNYIINKMQHGMWGEVSNRSFLFSSASNLKTYSEATLICCSLGMKLVSLQQPFKYDFLIKAAENITTSAGVKFWTSGTDLDCEGVYTFCPTQSLLQDEARWATGQPDDKNSQANCLAVNVSLNSALLSDEICTARMRYICEGWIRSGSKVIEHECATTNGLSEKQTKGVLKTSLERLSAPQKEFMRCYAEAAGLILDGNIVESKLLGQLITIAANNFTYLEDMLETMEYCSNLTKNWPVNDQLVGMLHCGQENAPEVVAQLLNNFEISLYDDITIFVPPPDDCPLTYPCFVDEDSRTAYETAPLNTLIYTPVYAFYKTVACGKTYLIGQFLGGFVNSQVNFFSYCCNFGLRLLSLDNKPKLDCLEPYFTAADAKNIFGPNASNLQFTFAAAKIVVNENASVFLAKDCFTNKYFNESDLQSTMGSATGNRLVTFSNRKLTYHRASFRFVCE
ncbi:uncharacterized protein LOC132192792 isoform X2 [Neocloeon triangulifer]|uniref:uncharacterized protein LOC132192792 isoform X2 n=1 Tax=Neocloeon triangulifer TaxID=2078957 RepID=UPI00286FA9B1|nr:uncharacterized protein LOC132192792 isoform X2 [Neocloeon triangulifer]